MYVLVTVLYILGGWCIISGGSRRGSLGGGGGHSDVGSISSIC